MTNSHDPIQEGSFRDIGGLITADGRAVRRGVVYRSEAPYSLDPGTLNKLGSVPFRLVLDLRARVEVHGATPAFWGSGPPPETMNFEVIPQERFLDHETHKGMLLDATGASTRQAMLRVYRLVPIGLETTGCLPEFARRVGSKEQFPVLVHCRNGRDRTGVFCALLLLLLGVDREVVIADYLRNEDHFAFEQVAEHLLGLLDPPLADGEEIVESALAPCASHRDYLEAALGLVETEYGSVDTYWRQAGGLDSGDLERLRDVLLTSAERT